ncbi:translation initiation factor SUI1 domain-containing protein [Ditylenchus destructor]|uniref:Density-regulated protein n=1 Tax=Ditylenchus destructor TaxID=166010 RepID=A0AAD4NK45_9BILA|nr:translation initiation factor SUI1 domain-containing protein [Ditylenchus destructor]
MSEVDSMPPSSDSPSISVTAETAGPQPGVAYPLKVHYCGECTMPIEYCEYSGQLDKCRQWLNINLPELVDQLNLGVLDASQDEKKHQKRGGKGTSKTVTKTDKPATDKAPKQKITVQRAPRSKTKSVTVIKGLTTCGIDLKVASKFFSSRFACGSSVTGGDEIVIQGDVKDDLFDVIPEKWKQVSEDVIEDLGDQKR